MKAGVTSKTCKGTSVMLESSYCLFSVLLAQRDNIISVEIVLGDISESCDIVVNLGKPRCFSISHFPLKIFFNNFRRLVAMSWKKIKLLTFRYPFIFRSHKVAILLDLILTRGISRGERCLASIHNYNCYIKITSYHSFKLKKN